MGDDLLRFWPVLAGAGGMGIWGLKLLWQTARTTTRILDGQTAHTAQLAKHDACLEAHDAKFHDHDLRIASVERTAHTTRARA